LRRSQTGGGKGGAGGGGSGCAAGGCWAALGAAAGGTAGCIGIPWGIAWGAGRTCAAAGLSGSKAVTLSNHELIMRAFIWRTNPFIYKDSPSLIKHIHAMNGARQ